MIYLNFAGTSWPKPAVVQLAIADAVARGPSHWGAVYDQALADVRRMLDVPTLGTFRFTTGCTAALGVVMNALAFEPGDELVTSGLEHHALARWFAPLTMHRGVDVQVSPYAPGMPFDLDFLHTRLLKGQVKWVALSAASNVTGERLPVEAVCKMAQEHGARVLVDGAQACGVVPVSLGTWGVDAFVFAAHKGLLGPHGLGGLWVRQGVPLHGDVAECGLENVSCAPELGFCDVGSVNLEGLAGLSAAIRWLEARPEPVGWSARAHLKVMADAITARHLGCKMLGAFKADGLPTVAFAGAAALRLGEFLGHQGVKVGLGMHCAPMAHHTLGAPRGTLRLSAGWATTGEEAERVAKMVENWDEKHLNS